MFSIVLRQVVSVCVTKTEELVLRSPVIFQRTVCTSKVLSSRPGEKNRTREFDLTEGLKLSKDPDELGKVVEVNLEDLQREDVDNLTSRKKERKKRDMKEGKSDKNVNNNLHSKESEEADKVIKKPKFEDLRRKSTDKFSGLMAVIKSKKGRENNKMICLEGKRLIHDAIKAGHKPMKVYFSRPSDLEKLNLPEEVDVYRIPYKKLQFWSDVVTSQGVIGIFPMPNLSKLDKKNTSSIPLTIVCDNVREPSNLGSILRVVASVGCEKLILTEGCVDIWEPKVLRSAAGAHFHLPILRNIPWNEIEQEITEEYQVVLASCESIIDENDSSEKETSVFTKSDKNSACLPLNCYSSIDYRNRNTVIVIGGETHGLSTQAVEFATKRKGLRVFIPMSNKVESLNNAVALGILSYMVRYQFESVNSSHQR